MLWDTAPVCKDYGNTMFQGSVMTAGFLEHLNEPAARRLTEAYTACDTAPFLGNGTMGMMLWQNESGLRFEINRSDAYDKRVGCRVLYGRNRILNGYYQLTYKGISSGKWDVRLSLWNAELSGTVYTSLGGFHINAYVHARHNLFVLHVCPFGQEQAQLDFIPLPPTAVRPILRGEAIDGWGEYPQATRLDEDDTHTCVQRLTNRLDGMPNPILDKEGSSVNAWHVQTHADGSVTYYIATGFCNPDASMHALSDAHACLTTAVAKGETKLRASHRAWWHKAYQKSFVSLPEREVESFYWIQLYKGLSAARKDSVAIDNFGPWFRPSGWSALWANLNVQMAYSPFAFAGHADVMQSFVRFLDAAQLQNCALHPNLPCCRKGSMALPTIMLADSIEGCVEPPQGKTAVRSTIGNLPYCLIDLWDLYAVTMDDGFLKKKLFPMLRGALLYYDSYLCKGKDNRLHLPYTWSPEWPVNTEDSNFELALIRWLCRCIRTASTRLKIDDPIATRAAEIEAQLIPYLQDEMQGLYVGKDEPYHRSHRHWSHLFAIYPTGLIPYDTAENKKLVDHSMQQFMSLPQEYTGFSWVAIASLYAACKNGDAARASLLKLLKAPYLWPNTMYTEMEELEWPTLETPMGVARSIQEMLVQVIGDVLEPFPSMPTQWQDACFSRLRAHGGLAVSAKRKSGATQWVFVESLAGEPCKIKHGITGNLFCQSSSSSVLHSNLRQKTITLENFDKGDWILLYRADCPKEDFIISGVAAHGYANAWGGRKKLAQL